MERLRAGAMSSSTNVLAPAAEPLLLCAWSGLVLGQLPAAFGQENSDLVVTVGGHGARGKSKGLCLCFSLTTPAALCHS
jgi:hypothetical protein